MLTFLQYISEATSSIRNWGTGDKTLKKIGQSGDKDKRGEHTVLWYKHPHMGTRFIDHPGQDVDITHATWMHQEGIKDPKQFDRLPRGRFQISPHHVDEFLHTGKETPPHVYDYMKRNYKDTRNVLHTTSHHIYKQGENGGWKNDYGRRGDNIVPKKKRPPVKIREKGDYSEMNEGLITEREHNECRAYKEWGVIHPKTGELISGRSHPKALFHSHLKELLANSHKSKYSNATPKEWKNAPEFAHIDYKNVPLDSHLSVNLVRPENKHHVMKAWKHLPHHDNDKVAINGSKPMHKLKA